MRGRKTNIEFWLRSYSVEQKKNGENLEIEMENVFTVGVSEREVEEEEREKKQRERNDYEEQEKRML